MEKPGCDARYTGIDNKPVLSESLVSQFCNSKKFDFMWQAESVVFSNILLVELHFRRSAEDFNLSIL